MILTIALALGVLLLVPAFLIGLVWIFQERIAFQPPPVPLPRAIHVEPENISQVSYLAQDNQPLLAYAVGNSETAKGLLLCFHGNADLAINAVDWARKVAQLTGFAVMLAEYRGYMNLGGQSSYLSSQLDAVAAFRHARDSLRFSPSHIAFYGHSLGTAVAAELAIRHRPLCLILESPFTSAHDMARVVAWRGIEIIWSAISRFHFDTIAAVALIDAPVWVAHGMRDSLISYTMGEQVFAAAKVKGRILLVPDATHSDVAASGGIEYWQWLQAALHS